MSLAIGPEMLDMYSNPMQQAKMALMENLYSTNFLLPSVTNVRDNFRQWHFLKICLSNIKACRVLQNKF